jgi:hypothetical protein
MPITNHSDCEVLSVIKFLKMKNTGLADIHHQLVDVYEEVVFKEEGMGVRTIWPSS